MHVEGKIAVYDINNKKINFKNVLITLIFNWENNAKEFENNFSCQIAWYSILLYFFPVFFQFLVTYWLTKHLFKCVIQRKEIILHFVQLLR